MWSAELDKTPPPLPADEVTEARAFLDWLAEDYFTFLGYREYDFDGSGEQTTTSIVRGIRPRYPARRRHLGLRRLAQFGAAAP